MLDKIRPNRLFTGKWVMLSRLAFLQGIGMALVFGSNLLFTNLLTTDQYGEYVSILQGVMLFSILLIGGVDEWITVELPVLIKSNDLSAAKALHRWSLHYLLKRFISILLIVTVTYLINWWLTDSWLVPVRDFVMGTLLAFFTTLLVKQCSELRSTGHYQLAQLVDTIAKPLALPVFFLLAIYLLQLQPSASVTIGSLLASIIILVFITEYIQQSKHSYLNSPYKAAIKNTTVTLPSKDRLSVFNWSSLLHFLFVRADLLILVVLGSNAIVGQYNVLNRVAEWCMLPSILLNTAHLKEVSEAKLTKSESGLPPLIKDLILKSAAYTVATACVLFLVGVGILQWFGSSYVEGYSLLFPMTLSFCCMATAAPMNHWLKVIGKEAISLRITWITVIAQLFLCTGFYYVLGIQGAAIGTLASNLLYLILQVQAMRSRH